MGKWLEKQDVLTRVSVFIMAVALSTSALLCIAKPTRIAGASMEPTFYDNDTVTIRNSQNPKSGDIVMFKAPYSNERLIKRVVALGGDSVQIIDGLLYINGEQKDWISGEPMNFAGIASRAVRVPDGQFFAIGDNRNASGDSRMFGAVPLENIEGIVNGLLFGGAGRRDAK